MRSVGGMVQEEPDPRVMGVYCSLAVSPGNYNLEMGYRV